MVNPGGKTPESFTRNPCCRRDLLIFRVSWILFTVSLYSFCQNWSGNKKNLFVFVFPHMAREPSYPVHHLLLVWVVAPLNMIPAAMATTIITPRITSASFTTIGQQSDPFLATARTVSFLHMDHFPRIGSNLSRRSTKGRALGGTEKHEN